MTWASDLFEKHKLVRRTVVAWAMGMITFATIQVYSDLTIVTPAVVSLYTVTVGLLGTAIGFYQFLRNKE